MKLKDEKNANYLLAMEKLREKQKEKFFLHCLKYNGDTIDLSNFEYNGVRCKGLCFCKLCGYSWEETPEILRKRRLCPICHNKERFRILRKKNLIKYKKNAEEKCKNKQISDIEFFYDEKDDLMVRFVCHEKYCDGTEHGIQIQGGRYFLKNLSCTKCAKHPSKAHSTEEWVRMAMNKYPEFTYEKVNYINKVTKVVVTCKKHGDFEINPKEFLHGKLYCPECTKERLHNEFVNRVISRAKKVHGNKYIYHPELIINSYEKMGIECKKHGIFWQFISNHIVNKTDCPQCAIEMCNISNENKKNAFQTVFINKSKEIHNNKYGYEKAVYRGNRVKVIISCPIHGEFEQTPHSHLSGEGCPMCAFEKRKESVKLSQEEFLERIKYIHRNKGYDFSKVVYDGCNEKVTVICSKHGEFKIKAQSLLNGCGCQTCRLPKLENEVRNSLIDYNIGFIQQKRFKSWLGKQSLDFFIPSKNIAIECQGFQHFKNGKRYQKLNEVQERDRKKKQLCKENNVHLIYYVPEIFAEFMKDDDIFFTDVNNLMDYIKSCK